MKKIPPIFTIAGLFVLGIIVARVFFGNNSGSDNTSTVLPPLSVQLTAAASAIITMTDDGYGPTEVTIKRGQVIKFVNNGTEPRWPASNIHPTHEIYSEFDPRRPVMPGSFWSFQFDRVGQWRFHDHLRPSTTGTITVQL